MPTITIDEKIVDCATEMLPAYYDIMYFLQTHAELYAAFENYRGSAKTEVDEYQEQQMKQMFIVAQSYSILAEDIERIVTSFLKFDEDIQAFSNRTIENMSEDIRNMLGV